NLDHTENRMGLGIVLLFWGVVGILLPNAAVALASRFHLRRVSTSPETGIVAVLFSFEKLLQLVKLLRREAVAKDARRAVRPIVNVFRSPPPRHVLPSLWM